MARWIEVEVYDGQGVVLRNGFLLMGYAPIKEGTALPMDTPIGMGVGSIELRNTPKMGLHIARFSGGGRFVYSLRLWPGSRYRLGPDRGHRVVPPREEKDPIKRVLRELDIPVSRLVRTEAPTLEVGERWYDNHHCGVGRDTTEWVTDGQKTLLSTEQWEGAHGYFAGGGYDKYRLSEANYVLKVETSRSMNGSDYRRVGQIIVWPTCSPDGLKQGILALELLEHRALQG